MANQRFPTLGGGGDDPRDNRTFQGIPGFGSGGSGSDSGNGDNTDSSPGFGGSGGGGGNPDPVIVGGSGEYKKSNFGRDLVRIRVKVRNNGATGACGAILYANGTRVATATNRIPSGGTKTLSVPVQVQNLPGGFGTTYHIRAKPATGDNSSNLEGRGARTRIARVSVPSNPAKGKWDPDFSSGRGSSGSGSGQGDSGSGGSDPLISDSRFKVMQKLGDRIGTSNVTDNLVDVALNNSVSKAVSQFRSSGSGSNSEDFKRTNDRVLNRVKDRTGMGRRNDRPPTPSEKGREATEKAVSRARKELDIDKSKIVVGVVSTVLGSFVLSRLGGDN